MEADRWREDEAEDLLTTGVGIADEEFLLASFFDFRLELVRNMGSKPIVDCEVRNL